MKGSTHSEPGDSLLPDSFRMRKRVLTVFHKAGFRLILFAVSWMGIIPSAYGAEESSAPESTDAIVLQADRVEVEKGNTIAEGNVAIEISQGTLRTEKLTYNSKDGVISIPGPFVIETRRGTLEGTNLRYTVGDERGGFDGVKGTYKLEEGVFFYFSGKKGSLSGEDITVEGVNFSNYSPVEKAGAQIRVDRLGFLGTGKRRIIRLERVQVYFLGMRLLALPRYDRSLETSAENPLFILPIVGFHRDAGVIAGLRWYVPYKSLLIGPGGAYSTRLGGLPSIVVSRQDTVQVQAFYGRDFLVNEVGRGKEVRFEPLVTLRYDQPPGRIRLGVLGTYAEAVEDQKESRWRSIQGNGTMEVLRFRNVRLVGSAVTSWDEYRTGRRTVIRGSVGITSETRRRGYFVGYLNSNHRGDSPFVFQDLRDRESAIVSYRRRISPSFEIQVAVDYDLGRRTIFSHTYTLRYFWRGVMFGISANPEFKNYNFLLGLDGL